MQALRNRPWYYPDHNISTECAKGGTAQCDGTDADGESCDCHCHGTTEDIGQTVPEVKAWHDAYWGVTVRAPQPGDLCRILGNFEVEHHDCDEFADGVVTNVVTGKIVR